MPRIKLTSLKTLSFFAICLFTYGVTSAQSIPTDSIPEVFSPNGDGINDVFMIPGSTAPDGDWDKITIYGRWGNDIFTASPYKNSWTGRNNSGEDLPEGTYFYLLEHQGEQYKGFVVLTR